MQFYELLKAPWIAKTQTLSRHERVLKEILQHELMFLSRSMRPSKDLHPIVLEGSESPCPKACHVLCPAATKCYLHKPSSL